MWFKAVQIDILMLTTNQITKYNVEGVTCSHAAVPLRGFFSIFQLFVLVLQPAALLFWFILRNLSSNIPIVQWVSCT